VFGNDVYVEPVYNEVYVERSYGDREVIQTTEEVVVDGPFGETVDVIETT
jgi:hypothetical protein